MVTIDERGEVRFSYHRMDTMKVKQWRLIPELHLLIKHLLYELDNTRQYFLSFCFIRSLTITGTTHFINIFSTTFLSLDDQQNKKSSYDL